VDGVDLRHDAEVALAVALGADDADRRLVDQVGIGAQRAGDADRLRAAAGMAVDENGARGHGEGPWRGEAEVWAAKMRQPALACNRS
jgi:hypothetical protein